MCVPNDFFGVQGCNNYQSFGICSECKWTRQTNYKINDANANFNPYMNTDLGLQYDYKKCKVNAKPYQFCFLYDNANKCVKCQLQLPIYGTDRTTDRQPIVNTVADTTNYNYCLDYYFINPELLKIASDGKFTCANPDSDKSGTYVIL